jgi:exo-beta-1,3-glucanase (GH17 family)
MTAPANPKITVAVYLLAVLLGAAALWFFWMQQGRALLLPEIVSSTHKLQCASYSPFDKEQSPLVPFTISPQRVDADLALLARYFSCVRTYSMTGFEAVPELAQKHGLKLMLGAWVSSDPVSTRKEIEQLVAAANRYPDVVQSLVIGNEALLRKEISGPRLAELITEVKGRVQQPVTYADVWEFWLKHPQIAPVVDFITIHLLPYWEDQPTGIENALEHVAEVREDFGHRFAPKDIFIGETGWPSAGRQRETAVPSRVNEARFMRGFIALAEHNGWSYNLIEAFDQPWKRQNEGAVGGYWGLFDADRHDKQVLAGPVSNLPEWRQWTIVAALIAGVGLSMAGRPRTIAGALYVPSLAVLGGVCFALWLQLAVQDNRNYWEWLWTLVLLLLNSLVLLRAMLLSAQGSGWRATLFSQLQQRASTLLVALGFVAAVLTLQLVFDARYREFPSYILLLPALTYARWPALNAPQRELRLLAAIIGTGVPWIVWQEKITNTQALGWAAVALLLTFSLWRSSRTIRSAAISSANTANVTV